VLLPQVYSPLLQGVLQSEPSADRYMLTCLHVLQARLLAGTFTDFEVYQRELAAGEKLVSVVDDAEHVVKLRACVALGQ
jgi:hypothetical protein